MNKLELDRFGNYNYIKFRPNTTKLEDVAKKTAVMVWKDRVRVSICESLLLENLLNTD